MRGKCCLFASAAWWLFSGHALGAQGAADTLDVTAFLVQVPVTVTDEHGQAVSDLGPEDFALRDQGVTQSLAFFQACGRRDSPSARPGALQLLNGAEEPQRGLGASPIAGPIAHRVVVLFEPMRFERRQRAIKSTQAFLSRKRDAGLLVALLDGPRLVTDFSDDIGLLNHRLTEIRSATPGVVDGLGNWCGPTAALLERLVSVPGRKSMVRFVDFDMPIGRDFLLALAIRADVALYLVDARGGQVLVPFGTASTEYGTAESTASGFQMIDGMSSQMAAWSDQQSYLSALAKATGGESLANGNDLGKIYGQMEERGRGLYLLGYYLSRGMLDGAFHKVDVNVKRERLQLRAKAGYFAPLR